MTLERVDYLRPTHYGHKSVVGFSERMALQFLFIQTDPYNEYVVEARL